MSARDLPLADLLAQLAGPSHHVDPLARVESGVVIGDGCTIKSGVFLARGTVLRQGVRVDANATFVELEDGERGTVVEDGARIGASAVVYAGLHIGAGAVIKPGAVVMQSVPAGATVAGHPAVIISRLVAETAKPGNTWFASNNADHERLAQID